MNMTFVNPAAAEFLPEAVKAGSSKNSFYKVLQKIISNFIILYDAYIMPIVGFKVRKKLSIIFQEAITILIVCSDRLRTVKAYMVG